jgi:hypothetical protein
VIGDWEQVAERAPHLAAAVSGVARQQRADLFDTLIRVVGATTRPALHHGGRTELVAEAIRRNL